MVREHLSQELKDAGWKLLTTTDELGMQAQGAMWLYDHRLEDWRYYLVTSLVDTLGRRKVYRLLLDAFERVDFPEGMTIEDVHLGSPDDSLFRRVSDLQEFLGITTQSFMTASSFISIATNWNTTSGLMAWSIARCARFPRRSRRRALKSNLQNA